MIDLKEIEHIYIYPGVTDMRLGIYGLRKKIIEIEGCTSLKSIYMFCGKSKSQLKLIEVTDQTIWLYQNKMIKGKFIWPDCGDKTELTKEQLILIINGMSLITSIENKGKQYSLF